MMKKILFAFALIFSALTAFAQSPKIEKHVGDVEDGYNFWLVEPEDVSGPKPIVIFLHGKSLCGTDMNKVKKYGSLDAAIKGREIDAYVIAPQNPGGMWKPEKVMNVLDYVRENYEVDNDRIYVVGMSLGGYGTIDFVATYPDQVAAAVAMCGGATKKDLSGLNEVPMWIIHGTADTSVAISKSDKVASAIKEVDKDAPRLVYDRVAGMNHSKPARIFYIPELYEWLFLHSLSDEGRPVHDAIKIDNSVLDRAYKGLNLRNK